MKILVVSDILEQKHIEQIKKAVALIGATVSFYKTEAEIPESDFDADVIYGFAPKIVSTSKKLKWLCVPWAGVDSLMKEGYFANEDCILTNSISNSTRFYPDESWSRLVYKWSKKSY